MHKLSYQRMVNLIKRLLHTRHHVEHFAGIRIVVNPYSQTMDCIAILSPLLGEETEAQRRYIVTPRPAELSSGEVRTNIKAL